MASEFDLVIRGGSIVDGSGGDAFQGDVGIKGDRIAALGKVDGPADKEIDAEGCVVTPGFIDGHTHMDAQVMWDHEGTCSCWHGVTTTIMGNCGFGLAPGRADQRELIIANIERAEAIPHEALAAGIDWTWETFPDYLSVIDSVPKGINYMAYIAHSPLRTWAMGERAFEEEANEDDLVRMEQQLRESLRAGAIGMSTSRSISHRTPDGRPVAHRQAAWSEVERLVSVMAEEGRGVLEINLAGLTEPREERMRKLDDALTLACQTGVPMSIAGGDSYHVDLANMAGANAFFQTGHARDATLVLSFKTSLPFDLLSEWQEVRKLSLGEQKRLFADPEVRQRLVDAASSPDAYPKGIMGAEARPPDYDRLYLFDHPFPPYRSVAEVAKERGINPVDLFIDLALETDFSALFLQTGLANHEDFRVQTSEHHQILNLRHRRSVLAATDAGAHVSQITDQNAPSYILGYWVREREVFTLPEAVHKLTAKQALAWGIPQRGFVREGYIADLNVFDPTTIAPKMAEVVNDLPGGAARYRYGAEGFRANIVNGQVTLQDGEHTGTFPGEFIRGPFARPIAPQLAVAAAG